ncbi:MAG TPA: NAD(P)-dependent oxidoreductase [Luteibacter sp.]|uniref:NAD-dependent epimerase/dehydratase family protein n=1 Tax=Luteibacter sp. TaxID=1886636 RepID=UPI002C3C4C50|nr:NAD(P)-dependent oxidoreductase [Luteibacter sp.]HVI56237.1 NAD(P)-dependent oxidoreductase [Luteibacter sp.]
MRVLVTGSAGHLGEALMLTLGTAGHEAIGLDLKASPHTSLVGSIVDRPLVARALSGVDGVVHTAALHKPHMATHPSADFVATNIAGTLCLLEECTRAGVRSFVFTSTTSVFGHALTPSPDEPAAWITEDVVPIPRNIYGVTKLAAEHLCEAQHRRYGLPCIVLRTSRFFQEADDDREMQKRYDQDNLKVTEYLYRRVDMEDVVSAHVLALEKAADIGLGRYIVSATTAFSEGDRFDLRKHARDAVRRHVPAYEREYARRGWTMLPGIDRVYINALARSELGWTPKYDFRYVIERLSRSLDYRSPLARTIGIKGYHAERFLDPPYPVENLVRAGAKKND